jgi:DNA-directed RNA polymerase specialized sigma24 family protein
VSSQGSVTGWLGLLLADQSAAAQPLWERYFAQLVRLAREQLRGAPRRAADEEDVALSAFDSFCAGARRGQFPRLADRVDLWRLLVVITARKAGRLVRDQRRQKRGGVVPAGAGDAQAALEQVAGREPSPEFAAQVAEECRRLLGVLNNDELRSVAVWKMEGCTNAEIAGRLRCAPRTVERKLRLIRTLWEEDSAP